MRLGTIVFALFTSCAAMGLAQSAPELFLSLRGIENRTTEVGEPVFVAVRVEVPEGTATLKLASGQSSWTELVSVELVGSSGSSRATVLREGPAEVTLDAETAASGVWYFPSQSTSALAPGTYEVRARLDLSGGAATSATTLPLRIVPANSTSENVQRVVALATEHLAQNRPEEAVKILDPRLEIDPDNARLLTARAQACVMGDDWPSARLCVERAIAKATTTHEGYPPIELTLMQQQLWARRPDVSALSLPPPWTRLPERLLIQDWESASPGARPKGEVAPAPVSTHVPAPPATAPASPASVPPRTETPPPAVVAAPAAPVSQATTYPPPSAPAATAPLVGMVVPSAELSDATIAKDPAGQWAVTASAGTQYGRSTQYSASQAIGAPNVSVAGNSPNAWCPAERDRGMDWFEAVFAEPVRATEVRVRQNDAAGAIVKVEAIAPDGTAHVWWEGVDPYRPGRVREIAWFAVRVPPTTYLVARVKLTLNLASGPGYKQIDAVQLVATDGAK